MCDDELQHRVRSLEDEVQALRCRTLRPGIRRASKTILFGLPLWSVAVGPDSKSGELRGRAIGVFAVGDIARGVVAVGGVARGFVALGGLAIGAFSIGGLSIGLFASLGGLAISGLLACGGLSVGAVAVGGIAIGYFACGGLAFGKYAISSLTRDPEAVQLFKDWIPWLR